MSKDQLQNELRAALSAELTVAELLRLTSAICREKEFSLRSTSLPLSADRWLTAAFYIENIAKYIQV